MTFQAGNGADAPAGTDGKQTSFNSGGGADQGSQGAGDNTVILEHGGRKFTKADLVNKLSHADSHIETLTRERAEDRKLLSEANEMLRKAASTAELLAKVKGEQPAGEQPNGNAPAQPAQQPTIKAEDIAAQVMGTLQQQQVAQQRKENFKQVSEALTRAFGSAVDAEVAKVAAESGITLEQAREMAESQPKVFLKLFPGIDKKAKPSVIPGGSVNSQSFKGNANEPSGITKATGRQATQIYLDRLKAAGL